MKKIGMLCIVVLLFPALNACKKESVQNTSFEEISETESYTLEETTAIEDAASEEVKEIVDAYKEVLEQDKYLEKGRYQLIYLNDDDIPELAVICDFAHVSGADIYAYIDGKAELLAVSEEEGGYDNFGQWGSLFYCERKGQIWWEYERNGGEGEFGFICQWNGIDSELKMLQSYAIDIYYENGNPSEFEEVKEIYSIDDNEVSREDYMASIDSWGEIKTFYYEDGTALSEVVDIEQSLYEAMENNGLTN